MANNKVVYKVVTKMWRSCSVHEASIYSILYNKGKTAKAVNGTVGIMCFKTKEHVEDYIENQWIHDSEELMIIKVRPIGRVKHPRQISGVLTPVAITDFYKRFKKVNVSRPADKEIRDTSNRLDRLWISNPPG